MITIDNLLALIHAGTLQEDASIEMKAKMNIHSSQPLIPIIVAIANAGGGYLVVGIEEKGFKVIGVDAHTIDILTKLVADIHLYTEGLKCTLSVEQVSDSSIAIIAVVSDGTTAYFHQPTSPTVLTAYHRDNRGRMIDEPKKQFSKRYSYVYKYMPVETFIMSMYSGSWRFFEPNKWADKFERRFYCAKILLPSASTQAPKLYATCVTREKESEAAWKVYASGQGLNQHCLQFKIDVAEFRNQLRATGMAMEERVVEYWYEGRILDLHKKKSPDYNSFFKHFALRNFFNLLSLKRKAYSYEKEVRFFLVPKDDVSARSFGKQKADSKDVKIQWNKIIKSVRIDKQCSPAEMIAIREACHHALIDPIIKNSNYKWPYDNQAPVGAVQIPFEIFCIDDMPGVSRIVIK